MDRPKLIAALSRLADALNRDLNEDDIERLHQPIYEALGYMTPGLDIRGKRKGEAGQPDVVLLNGDSSFNVVVELKNPSESLGRWERKTFRYFRELKPAYGILSNGREIRLYSIEESVCTSLGHFHPTDLANEPQPFERFAKNVFDLADYATIESRIDYLTQSKLPLRSLGDLASEVFLETFGLDSETRFAALVRALGGLFDALRGNSRFLKGSFDFWSRFHARTLSKNDIPAAWLYLLPPNPRIGDIKRFMFLLETAYTLSARLILAKAVQDTDKDHALVTRGLSEEAKTILKTKVTARTGKLPFRSYVVMVADIFNRYGGSLFTGIYAEDIFDWWRDHQSATEGAQDGLGNAIANLLFVLLRFDFGSLQSDLLGELYQQYFDAETRKALGEFYTPPELVEFILDEVGYDGKGRLLDPACGSGTFLVRALRRYLRVNRARDPLRVLRGLTDEFLIVGFDINPFAVLMSEINVSVHLISLYAAAAKRSPTMVLRRLPIIHTDSLRQEFREGEPATTGLQFGLEFGAVDLKVCVDLPVKSGEKPLRITVAIPRLDPAIKRGLVQNATEWLLMLQSLFHAVDAQRRIEEPSSIPPDLKPALRKSLSRTFKNFEDLTTAIVSHADEIWKLLGMLREKHGDGRFIKTIEDIVLGLALKHDIHFQFVVGNPPYVRIQNLPEFQRGYWANRYTWAKGNYDIYVPFLERPFGTERPWLQNGGRLGFVMSNSFFVSEASTELRTQLPVGAQVLSVTDFKAARFDDGNLFSDAMTYTCVLVAQKKDSAAPSNYVFPVVRFFPRPTGTTKSSVLTNLTPTFTQLRQIPGPHRDKARLLVPSEKSPYADAFWDSATSLKAIGWFLMPTDERVVFDKMETFGTKTDRRRRTKDKPSGERRLITYTATQSGGFAGVQTSLDDVFIVTETERDPRRKLVKVAVGDGEQEIWLEEECLRQFIFGKDVWRWRTSWRHTYVLFPYFRYDDEWRLLPTKRYWDFVIGGRGNRHRAFDKWPDKSPFLETKYPLLWKYLCENEQPLRERENHRFAVGETDEWRWYDLAYPRSLNETHQPKIVVQLLARSRQFALDEKGEFLFQAGGKGGGVYGILPVPGCDRVALLGLLNSKASDFYIRHVTQFYNSSGSASYADAFIRRLPIPTAPSRCRKAIGAITKSIREVVNNRTEVDERIRQFPASVTDCFRRQGHAIEVDSLANLFELNNLPARIEKERLRFSDLLDGDVEIDVGRGKIRLPKAYEEVVKSIFVIQQNIERDQFADIRLPIAAEDIKQYLSCLVSWQKERESLENSMVRSEKELDDLIGGLYTLGGSDLKVIDRYLTVF